MIATDFRALVIFAATVALWAGIELVLGRRSYRARLASTSRWPEVAINVSTVVVVVAAVLLAASAPSARINPAGLAFALGIAMMVGGVGIRTASARSLGCYYTLDLGIQPGQEVCSQGLYRWIRHPGYAGTLVALLGLGTALGSWYSVLAITFILPALAVRIALEERMLTDAFEEAYPAYCRRTRWRLLPGVL